MTNSDRFEVIYIMNQSLSRFLLQTAGILNNINATTMANLIADIEG